MKDTFLKILPVAILLFIVTNACKKEINVTGVNLNKTTLTLPVGETATLVATVLPDDATNKAVSWTSSNTNKATVVRGVVTAKELGTVTITVTTEDGNYMAECTVTVVPAEQGVVINGVRWATRNVAIPGTFTAHPEDAGMFYQWNKKVGWSTTDPMINSNGGTKWNTTDAGGDTWEKANDPCPKGWRVPTYKEQEKLYYAESEWTTLNGVNGRLFGDDDNTLFLPAAGYRDPNNGSLNDVNTAGWYWFNNANISAYSEDGILFLSVHPPRIFGSSVRCVAE
jgi:hypothetical protein